MNHLIIITLLVSAIATAQLNDLIRLNIQSSVKSTETLFAKKENIRLWIHARSEEQKVMIIDNLQIFSELQIDSTSIELKPVQLVSKGPRKPEIRFYNKNDNIVADHLRKALSAKFAGLTVKDMSHVINGAQKISSGHIELWLSPDTRKFDN